MGSCCHVTTHSTEEPYEGCCHDHGPAHNPDHCGCEAEIACLCPCWMCQAIVYDGTDG